ncbi:helix-turn-helix domain-containing protein [Cetobacterium sp.]|uniref:helix-turn-helix domain-containing protein n=1 Tax=Cetobacterium sp. TaxID=2071632 RepID=UPI003F31A142
MTDFIKLQGIFEQGYGIIAKKVMRDKSLNVIAKSIYSYICSYSGKGSDAFPSQKLICNDLDISKDTLIKYTNQLKEKGYITVKQEKEKGKFARNVYTINIVPCMVSSDTVKTDTEVTGYGEVDTINNNSLNNNNNINNNNKKIDTINQSSLDNERVEFRKNFREYINIVSKSTGLDIFRIENVIQPSLFKDIEIKEVIEKIKESDFLQGLKEDKPKIGNFTTKNMLNRILIDSYKNNDKKEIKKENIKPEITDYKTEVQSGFEL